MAQKYYVDGNSSDLVDGFNVWRVLDFEGTVVATLYGPFSFIAANGACKAMNEGMGTPEAQDHFSTNRG